MAIVKILHIEDDPSTLGAYQRLLTDDIGKIFAGQTAAPIIDQASDWEAARRAMTAGVSYDLIIYDLRFPNDPSGGRDDTEQQGRLPELRRWQPEAAVAVATSYAYQRGLAVCNEVLSNGLAEEFIPKDEDWPLIVKRLRLAHRRRSDHRLASQPLRPNIAATIAEDIEARLSECESRIRAVSRGNQIEGALTLELRNLRQEIATVTKQLSERAVTEPLDLSIDGILGTLKSHYSAQTGQELRCDTGEIHIRTYHADLEEALKAVFQNAIDAMQDTGKELPTDAVRIEVEREERRVLISVIDRGAGFDPEALVDLFAPGKTHWRSREKHHNGLGLYVARRRLFSIGGDLTIQRDTSKVETRVILSVYDWEPSR